MYFCSSTVQCFTVALCFIICYVWLMGIQIMLKVTWFSTYTNPRNERDVLYIASGLEKEKTTDCHWHTQKCASWYSVSLFIWVIKVIYISSSTGQFIIFDTCMIYITLIQYPVVCIIYYTIIIIRPNCPQILHVYCEKPSKTQYSVCVIYYAGMCLNSLWCCLFYFIYMGMHLDRLYISAKFHASLDQ